MDEGNVQLMFSDCVRKKREVSRESQKSCCCQSLLAVTENAARKFLGQRFVCLPSAKWWIPLPLISVDGGEPRFILINSLMKNQFWMLQMPAGCHSFSHLWALSSRLSTHAAVCSYGVCFNGGRCREGSSQLCDCPTGFDGPSCQYGE